MIDIPNVPKTLISNSQSLTKLNLSTTFFREKKIFFGSNKTKLTKSNSFKSPKKKGNLSINFLNKNNFREKKIENFEIVKNFVFYFPHNNISSIIFEMERKNNTKTKSKSFYSKSKLLFQFNNAVNKIRSSSKLLNKEKKYMKSKIGFIKK